MTRALALLAALALPAPGTADTLPFDVGGAFALTDQTGTARTETDPEGRAQLLFFGYANCLQICSAALPLMAEIVRDLSRDGVAAVPVMVTVDPDRDTVGNIGPPLAAIHPDFIGLTGSDAALQIAYDAFAVEKKHIFDDPEYGPVYAHGSFIYLLDASGDVLSVLPPVLSPEQAGAIVRARLAPAG